MIKIPLDLSFFKCPVPWQHLINELQIESDSDCDVPVECVNVKLTAFGGTYVNDPLGLDHMQFATESGYTMFVLKYS